MLEKYSHAADDQRSSGIPTEDVAERSEKSAIRGCGMSLQSAIIPDDKFVTSSEFCMI